MEAYLYEEDTELGFDVDDVEEPLRDPVEEQAIDGLEHVFERNPEKVFFSRQLEVIHEDKWFHWVTNRALRELVARDVIRTESRELVTGASVHLMWHRSYRYYRREAARVVRLLEEYASPNIGAALGLQGEALVLDGFARKQFVLHGRETRTFDDRTWTQSDHNLDFIFLRDGMAYGVEVKNQLKYIDEHEMRIKIRMCSKLGLRPVFAVRMLPKSWINVVNDVKGFGLIFKYQLYPWGHRDLARRVRRELGLPVDSPRALADGTMERFLSWHRKQV